MGDQLSLFAWDYVVSLGLQIVNVKSLANQDQLVTTGRGLAVPALPSSTSCLPLSHPLGGNHALALVPWASIKLAD